MDLFGVLIFGFIMIFGVVGKVEAVTSLIPAQDCSVGAVCDWSDADNAVRICKDGYIDRNWSMYSGHTCNGQKRVIDASGVDVSYMYGPNLNAPTAYGDNSGYSCSSGGLTWVRPSNASLGAPMAYVVMVNDRSINADYVPTSTASNYDPKDKWIVVTDHQVALGYAALNLTPGVSYDIGVWPYYLNEPYGKWSRHSIYRIGPQVMCAAPTNPPPTKIPVRCVSSSISSGSLDMSNVGNTVTVTATIDNPTGNWNSLAMYNLENLYSANNPKDALLPAVGNVKIGNSGTTASYQDNAIVNTVSATRKTFTWAVKAGDISGIDAATGKVVNDLQFHTYAGGWPIENMESCVQKLHLSRTNPSPTNIPSTALLAPTSITYSCSNTTLTWNRPTNAGSNLINYVIMVNDHKLNDSYLPGTGTGKDPNDQWIVVNDQQSAINLSKSLSLVADDSIDIAVQPYYKAEDYAQWSRHGVGIIGPQIMCTSPTSPSPTRIPVRCVSSSISSGSLDMSNLGNTVTVIATMANATGNWNSLAMYNIGNTDAGGNAKPAIITGGNVHIGATAGQPSYQDNAAVSTSGPNKTFTWAVRAGDISGIDAATGKVVNDLQFNTYAGGWPIENMESCVQRLHLSRVTTSQPCSVGAVCDWSDADNAVRICKDGYIDRNWSMYSGHTCNGQKRVVKNVGGVEQDVSYMYGPNLNAPTVSVGNGYSCSSKILTWNRPANAGTSPLAYVVMVNDRSTNVNYTPTTTDPNYDPKDRWIVISDQKTGVGSTTLNLTPGVSYDIGVWPYYVAEPFEKWPRHSIYRFGPQVMCTAEAVRCVSSGISSGSLDMSSVGNTVTVTATIDNPTGNWNTLAMYNIGNTDSNGNARPAILVGDNVHIGATAGQPSYQNNATVSTISTARKTFSWIVKAGDIGGTDAATGKVVNDLQFNTYAGGWPIENMESCVQKLHLSRAGDSTYSCPGTPVACACAGPGCKNDGGLGTDWRCCHRTCVNNSCRTVTGSGANSCATDGVSCSSTLLGDYNNDAKVDISDFMIWKDRYNLGQMTFGDFLVWKTAYLAPETISSTIAPP